MRGTDNMTRAGADRLAGIIKDFWQARGYEVTTRLEQFGQIGSCGAICGVRSDLINGMPRKWAKAEITAIAA